MHLNGTAAAMPRQGPLLRVVAAGCHDLVPLPAALYGLAALPGPQEALPLPAELYGLVVLPMVQRSRHDRARPKIAMGVRLRLGRPYARARRHTTRHHSSSSRSSGGDTAGGDEGGPPDPPAWLLSPYTTRDRQTNLSCPRRAFSASFLRRRLKSIRSLKRIPSRRDDLLPTAKGAGV